MILPRKEEIYNCFQLWWNVGRKRILPQRMIERKMPNSYHIFNSYMYSGMTDENTSELQPAKNHQFFPMFLLWMHYGSTWSLREKKELAEIPSEAWGTFIQRKGTNQLYLRKTVGEFKENHLRYINSFLRILQDPSESGQYIRKRSPVTGKKYKQCQDEKMRNSPAIQKDSIWVLKQKAISCFRNLVAVK